ncbi:hypothetical protein [Trinickia dabaoshanensis]|nr:hypothetical protein [Trinickia dabaoshanensis]
MKKVIKSLSVFASFVCVVLSFPMLAYAEHLDVPDVVKVSRVDSPYAFPVNNGVARPDCYKDNGSPPKESFDCSTIKYFNLTYWPLNYDDNRSEILLVGVASHNYGIGKPKLIRVCGLRYLWKIEVDEIRKQLTLFGQDDSKTTLPWPILADDGKDQSTCAR